MLKVDDDARKFLMDKIEGDQVIRVFFGGFG